MSSLSFSRYAKLYRTQLNFSTQTQAKDFLAAKDIAPSVDMEYLRLLNERLRTVARRVNDVLHHTVSVPDFDAFCVDNLDYIYDEVMRNNLLPRLNNQGRRCEQVYYSWTRGMVMMRLFETAIAKIFEVEPIHLEHVGDDDFSSPETFRRTPKADIKLSKSGRCVYLEMQSGFQGINDVKQHKVLEAKRRMSMEGTPTAIFHADLYNGQAAVFRLDVVAEDDIRWITRQQMEGQTVFEIDQNNFVWRILEEPPSYREIEAVANIFEY